MARDPGCGDVIPGMGGIRKLRLAAGGQNKRGAFRVIHYLLNEDMPVLALPIYGVGEQANPTPEQKKAMMEVAAGFEAASGRGRRT